MTNLADRIDAIEGSLTTVSFSGSGSSNLSESCDTVREMFYERSTIAAALRGQPRIVQEGVWWVPPAILALIIGVVIGAFAF